LYVRGDANELGFKWGNIVCGGFRLVGDGRRDLLHHLVAKAERSQYGRLAAIGLKK